MSRMEERKENGLIVFEETNCGDGPFYLFAIFYFGLVIWAIL